MSQRREKRIRKLSRKVFECAKEIWVLTKPPWWRFRSRRAWRKREPTERYIRKAVKEIWITGKRS